jgi:hypothetical protein
MEFLSAFIGGVLGIVGAFAGAWAAHRYERNKEKGEKRRDITLELYTEYQSPEMLKARIVAREVFDRRRQQQQPLLLSDIWETTNAEEYYSISLVMTFLEKFGVYLDNDYLDKSIAKQLLGRDFSYWYRNYIYELIETSEKEDSTWAVYITEANRWLN